MKGTVADKAFLDQHTRLLITSYYHLLGEAMPNTRVSDPNRVQVLHGAPYGIVSHGTESDPVFNYANRTALDLFEMSWDTFTRLASRKSAEPVNRVERQQLLDQVSSKGYIDHYQGVRISSSGKRFRIEDAVVWNLVDERNIYRGQAALFHRWEML